MGAAGYSAPSPRGIPPTPRASKDSGTQMSVSERDVLAAMSKVMDPELHIDLVKAGMVKDIRVDGTGTFATAPRPYAKTVERVPRATMSPSALATAHQRTTPPTSRSPATCARGLY